MLSPNGQKSRNTFLIGFIIALFLLQTVPAAADTNPSPAEISRKLEAAAVKYQVPAEILKAVAFVESGWRQFDGAGRPVASRDRQPGLGIMQITSYNAADAEVVSALKYDIDYNIATGAKMLLLKWEATPRIGDGDKSKLENWYFALWAYNSWSMANNPHSAALRGRAAYQDKILKLMNTAYLDELTPPVAVTPIPPSSLPAGSLPKRATTWNTPTPVHVSNISAADPSRGGSELFSLFARISGVNRCDTAAQIAVTAWLPGCSAVVVAPADNYLNSLVAIPLSEKEGAPILLTGAGALDHRAERALQYLQPMKVILLGRELSEGVENQIRALLPQAQIERLGGADHFETAARVATEFPAGRAVALISDAASPDALSLAATAAAAGYPLLLTEKNSLPAVTQAALAELQPSAIITAGGESLMADSVLAEALRLAALPPEALTRYAGADRYETSAAVMRAAFPHVGKIYLASGETLADALSGAALAAQQSLPLLLVSPAGVAEDGILADYLRSLPAETEIEIFGGTAAVPDSTAAAVQTLLGAGQ
ncbi:MAG: cell wall-binding repeat-containing protein [Gracilibacteraceae bacterium]|jgi:putative cell wall-binding protein|nr:cell wall-binding repeat-containing protein [Gracilibacteraceae bacterium]